LTPSLNLPDAELPSVLSALQSEKQRRLTEDRLKYYAACFGWAIWQRWHRGHS
jgi:hypothetical protein